MLIVTEPTLLLEGFAALDQAVPARNNPATNSPTMRREAIPIKALIVLIKLSLGQPSLGADLWSKDSAPDSFSEKTMKAPDS